MAESLLKALGSEIDDPEEEAFLLFSQSIPSQDLGFVDPKATSLELTINGRDLTIHQSPTLLSSNRGGGTTGAVVWKITPLFASWITQPANLLFKHGILQSTSTVLELGCGISGIIGLSLGPTVGCYTLTDQDYVSKLLSQNLEENCQTSMSGSRGRKSSVKPKKRAVKAESISDPGNIMYKPLDWETDEVTTSLIGVEKKSFDVVIACDCIYNDALIDPLVQTSIDACKLRLEDTDNSCPTICLVAQQLRSSEVFEGWLKAFHERFRVWRIPDEELIDGLKTDSGFVVHIGVLRA
ncbi:uncharacterized protein LY89DRAFT_723598 [Mollisia scopiformis]|uniref:Diaminohydroxyphosphoribosylamino-pyrimidine deaminase n=1 Tax=Mollisia scopiformis TaxID=149040 RepID=A0A132BF74_MOLSC|nr:uncharacterized protein LY89DRAFT_723598 [Mollisia scopiformis]KUJ10357.1 hypothetical protein LY89DRAFT_723598 [Mollisia scopiformis]